MAIAAWIVLLAVVYSNIATADAAFYFEDYTECGGVLPIRTGYVTPIDYNVLGDHNFCIWTLHAQTNVESVRIQATPPISSSDDYALIAYFWNGTDLTSQRLTSNNTDSIFKPPPSFLSLTSERYVSPRHVHITLTPTGNGSEPLKGSAFHLEAAEGELSYPENPLRQYKNNDQVSIVLPTRKFNNPETAKETKVKAVDVQSGHDIISVYELHYNWDTPLLQLLGRCSGTDEVSFVSHYAHPTIILFTADEDVTGKGFTVQWGNFSFKKEL